MNYRKNKCLIKFRKRKKQRIMHKNKYNKLCKTNEKIMIEWKMLTKKKNVVY